MTTGGGDTTGRVDAGLEARRGVPRPQTLWLAQDLLLWLAWHALPWLARLTLLSELMAQVQQGYIACGRTNNEAIVLPLEVI